MRTICTLLLLIALFSNHAPARAQVRSVPVSLTFTVTDESGHALKTLRKEDVRLVEEGVGREVTGFELHSGVRFSLAMLIDTSVSQARILPAEKIAARAFVELLVKPGTDLVSVSSFEAEAKQEQGLTDDPALLRQAIERINFEPPPGYEPASITGILTAKPPPPNDAPMPGSTDIWNTLWEACAGLENSPTGARRAIILLTDGNDTAERRKMSEAVERAIRKGVAVYSIGIGDEEYGGTDKNTLRKLSERTGGRAFFPKTDLQLQAAFTEIGEALRSQYVVAYESANLKQSRPFRKVRIEIVNPELRRRHLHLAQPEGYFTN
jgi:Ca-activated chloride channel family protein